MGDTGTDTVPTLAVLNVQRVCTFSTFQSLSIQLPSYWPRRGRSVSKDVRASLLMAVAFWRMAVAVRRRARTGDPHSAWALQPVVGAGGPARDEHSSTASATAHEWRVFDCLGCLSVAGFGKCM